MTTFTPGTAALGGLLIGIAAVLLLLGAGRVAGISGSLGTVVARVNGEIGWRVFFLAGLPLGGLLVSQLRGELVIDIAASPAVLVIAGLLVGFGSDLGSGCTSGHGVCGLSRGSRRSLAATLTFMAAGALTVFVIRHGLRGA